MGPVVRSTKAYHEKRKFIVRSPACEVRGMGHARVIDELSWLGCLVRSTSHVRTKRSTSALPPGSLEWPLNAAERSRGAEGRTKRLSCCVRRPECFVRARHAKCQRFLEALRTQHFVQPNSSRPA